VRCELCNENEALGQYIIEDSHWLDAVIKRTMWLCKFCVEDLEESNVHLTKILPKFPAIPEESN